MYDKAKIWNQDVKDVITNLKYEDRIAAACEIYNLAKNEAVFHSKLSRSESHELLNCLWQCLQPDTGKRRDNVDETSEILKLHLVALKILYLSNLPGSRSLIDSSIVSPNNLNSIMDFTNLESTGNPHAECCSRAAKKISWDPEAITFARNTLVGQIFKCVIEESNTVTTEGTVYNAILYDHETTEDIVDVLSKHARINANNLTLNLNPNATSTENIKVVHVVAPNYVYVQSVDDSEDLEELKEDMAEYLGIAYPVQRHDTNAIVKLEDFLFRADILSWGEKTAQVFAIDYGWKAEIPISRMYGIDENIMELPKLAKLCHLININHLSINTQIQFYAIKLLQTFAVCNDRFSLAILHSSNLGEIFQILKNTRNANLVQAILLLCSQLSAHRKNVEVCARVFMNPVISCVRRWCLCPDVVKIGLECLRNMVINKNNLVIKDSFIDRAGLELTFKAFSSYSEDSQIREHCLHILKFCLKGFEFETPSDELDRLEVENLSISTSRPAIQFSHLHNMSEYKISQGNQISFLEDIMKPHETATFAREVVSHLNTQSGGVIYIGVTAHGLVNGLKLNRLRKDEYRVKIDSVLRKMICDYRQVELPEQLFECNFELVKNQHNRALPEDVEMYILVLNIKPSGALARVTVDTIIFWKRENGNSIALSANDIRQHIAKYAMGPMGHAYYQPQPAHNDDKLLGGI